MAVDGNTVTTQVGELAPNAKVTLEIPVSVGSEVGPNISTQASAQYSGAPDPVQSNAYIAQVAEAAGDAPASPPQADPQAKPQNQPQTQPHQQPQGQPQSKPQTQPQSKPSSSEPQTKPANTQPKQNAPMPQTGGSFPIVLAVVLVAVTLLARYLRARRPRRA
jgi:cobalamin biosynthesis Mg chelatase CobN